MSIVWNVLALVFLVGGPAIADDKLRTVPPLGQVPEKESEKESVDHGRRASERIARPQLPPVEQSYVDTLQRMHTGRIWPTTPADREKIKGDMQRNVTASALSTQKRLELLVTYLSSSVTFEVFNAKKENVKFQLPPASVLLGPDKLTEAARFLAGNLDPLKKKPAEHEAIMVMLRWLHKELKGSARTTADGISAAGVLKRAYATRYREEFKPGKEEEWAKSHEFLRPFTFVKLGIELADENALLAAKDYIGAFDKHYGAKPPGMSAMAPYLESIKIAGSLLRHEPINDTELSVN